MTKPNAPRASSPGNKNLSRKKNYHGKKKIKIYHGKKYHLIC